VEKRWKSRGPNLCKWKHAKKAASATATTEAILITGVIKAKHQRDIMTLDIPGCISASADSPGWRQCHDEDQRTTSQHFCEICTEVHTS